MTTWQKDGLLSPLQKLAELTLRLMRLSAVQTLARGQAQLISLGAQVKGSSNDPEAQAATKKESALEVISTGSFDALK